MNTGWESSLPARTASLLSLWQQTTSQCAGRNATAGEVPCSALRSSLLFGRSSALAVLDGGIVHAYLDRHCVSAVIVMTLTDHVSTPHRQAVT